MARKRVKVGTLIGTENRNDDESILRTPLMQFGTAGGSPSMPTETTTPQDRPEPSPAPGNNQVEGGDGSGSNGPAGGGGQLGGKDMSLADFTESAIAAVSNMNASQAPSGLGKGLGMVSDVLNSVPSDAFGTFGEKPGLGMQTKSQAQGTLAQAKSMSEEDEDTTNAAASTTNKGYAPPSAPVFSEEDKGYVASTDNAAAQAAQAAESAAPAGVAGSSQNSPNFNESTQSDQSGGAAGGAAGNDTMGDPGSANDAMNDGGSGTDSGVGDGTGDGTGDGSGPGGGGSGAPGGSSDGGPGSWEKGVIDIQGSDPTREGEAIPGNTLHEGETVLTAGETTLIGEKALRRIKKIAADKNTSLSKRRQSAAATILAAM